MTVKYKFGNRWGKKINSWSSLCWWKNSGFVSSGKNTSLDFLPWNTGDFLFLIDKNLTFFLSEIINIVIGAFPLLKCLLSDVNFQNYLSLAGELPNNRQSTQEYLLEAVVSHPWMCPKPGTGTGWPLRSLPTPRIPWFFDETKLYIQHKWRSAWGTA